ncbi:MAG: hypothetical protein H6733_10820 [Alphaproteobacteria bacterium]|nr:hypothetical protein [Alphaproteobacteria bacterium]
MALPALLALLLPLASAAPDDRPLAIPDGPGRPPPQAPARPPAPPPVVVRPAPAPRTVVVAPAAPVDRHPRRAVDRNRTFGFGVWGGAMVTGYRGGTAVTDAGLGLLARWRPVELVGIEATVVHYDQTFDVASARRNTVGQLSAQVFLVPWAPVTPYLTGGLTLDYRATDDTPTLDGTPTAVAGRALYVGPHGGLGLEVALGQRFALDLDVRATRYLNVYPHEAQFPASMQANVALLTHF